MWGGFTWGGAAWASQPEYGTSHPGVAFGGDYVLMRAYGGDSADGDVVFGGDKSTGGSVSGGGDSRGAGYAYGGDESEGKVVGGDERAG